MLAIGERTENIIKKFPEAGMALHGTTLSRARLIQKDGLYKGHPYCCPLPNFRLYEGEKKEATGQTVWSLSCPMNKSLLTTTGILNKAIGSILWSLSYATMNSAATGWEDAPAIVVFSSWRWEWERKIFGEGYDLDRSENRFNCSFKQTNYDTFGKEVGAIDASYVSGIVTITEDKGEIISMKPNREENAIRKAIMAGSVEPWKITHPLKVFEKIIKDSFIVKTFAAIERIVNAGENGGYLGEF